MPALHLEGDAGIGINGLRADHAGRVLLEHLGEALLEHLDEAFVGQKAPRGLDLVDDVIELDHLVGDFPVGGT